MRLKSAAAALAGVLAAGVGGGYLADAAANPQPASAQSPPASPQASNGSMMGGAGSSMMSSTTSAQCARMMHDPAMRRLYRRMLRDPAMRREMHKFPAMAAMMGDQTGR